MDEPIGPYNLLEQTPFLITTAASWLRMLYVRLLNSEGTQQILQTNLDKMALPQRQVIRRAVEKLFEPEYVNNSYYDEAVKKNIEELLRQI